MGLYALYIACIGTCLVYLTYHWLVHMTCMVHRAETPNEKHHRSGTRIYVEGNCQLNSIILWVDYVLAKRMIYD